MTASPEDPAFRAVRRMAAIDVGRVPVVDPVSRRVVGMLRRADVVRAYQRGITRSAGSQQRQAAGRLRDLVGVQFVEVVLDRRSPVAGKRIHEIAWPARTVVTSIRRRGEVIVPDGDTALEADDELIALTADPVALRKLVAGETAEG